MARKLSAKLLKSSNTIVVTGVVPADKCLFTPFTTPTLVRFDGEVAFQISGMYRDKVVEIVRRNNAFVAAQEAEKAAQPVATGRIGRRNRTSSGWCEACEDGAINLCKHGGCY